MSAVTAKAHSLGLIKISLPINLPKRPVLRIFVTVYFFNKHHIFKRGGKLFATWVPKNITPERWLRGFKVRIIKMNDKIVRIIKKYKDDIYAYYWRPLYPNVGLSINEVRTYVKCYMGDTGLLVSHAFDENELLEDEVYKQILSGKLSMNEGMLYENVIAQMLTANGHKLYFYTHYNEEKHRNDIEIDFILSNNSKLKYKIYPIEVKSGAKYTTTSLSRFKEKYKNRIGESYIVHPRNLMLKDDIVCIPPYMVMML